MASEEVEAQNGDLNLDEAFFEYLGYDVTSLRELFINARENALGAITHLDGDEYLKVQTAFTVGKMHATLLLLLEVIPYAFEKRGIQDSEYRHQIVDAIKALAKAYVDIVITKRYIGDVRNDLQRAYEDLDEALVKAIRRLVEA